MRSLFIRSVLTLSCIVVPNYVCVCVCVYRYMCAMHAHIYPLKLHPQCLVFTLLAYLLLERACR